MKIASPLAKFSIFAMAMLIVLFALVVVFGKLTFESTSDYAADFTDVSGLKSGQFVRIAGVEVGRIEGIKIVGDTTAHVTFSLDTDVVLTAGTRALVRYENLIGDRYLELTQGPGDPTPLRKGATIAIDHTAPALDLDAVIGGFRPLFKALDADQVNKLSGQLIAVLQGEAGTIAGLLNYTAQITTFLADRDSLIGQVISNLNKVLGTVDDNNRQFDSLIDNLQKLVSGIAAQTDPVANALVHVSDVAEGVASLLNVTRPDISGDIAQLGRVSANVDNDHVYVDGLLSRLPNDYQRLARLGLYGDFFNFYLCDVTLKVNGPKGDPIYINAAGQRAGRCKPPQ